MAKTPLLDLTTLIERPRISIDGTSYDILSPEELSILDSQAFTFWGAEIERLAKEKGEEEAKELAALIDTVAKKVLVGVPPDIFAKLTGAHKFRVVEVFTMLLLREKVGAVGAMAQVMRGMIPSTGAKNSPGSSATTAVPPTGGSRKRRPRS